MLKNVKSAMDDMKTFRYIELNNKPEWVEPKFKIGDLVQMVTHADWEDYGWKSFGKIGLVSDVKFFIQETLDPKESIKYVTEYKVEWVDNGQYAYLDESMLAKI